MAEDLDWLEYTSDTFDYTKQREPRGLRVGASPSRYIFNGPATGGIVASPLNTATITIGTGTPTLKAEAVTAHTIDGHVPQIRVAGNIVWEGAARKTAAKAAQAHLEARVAGLFE